MLDVSSARVGAMPPNTVQLTRNAVGTGLAPVRETVARVDRTGCSVPFTRLRTGVSPVPTSILLN
jgi:hypothetical protein